MYNASYGFGIMSYTIMMCVLFGMSIVHLIELLNSSTISSFLQSLETRCHDFEEMINPGIGN